MKKPLIAILVAGLMAPALSFAEKGDFVVRARATYVAPDESSKLKALSGVDHSLEVESNTIPEIDFSYYITKNIAAELILATGTRHDVNVVGSQAEKLGSVNLLPPTLTVQWHFNPDQQFDPYAGAGVSYIRAMDNGLASTVGITDRTTVPAGTGIHTDRNMWGPAIQAGIEVTISAEKISVKGPQGTLSLPLTGQVIIKNENNTLTFAPADESREAVAMSRLS